MARYINENDVYGLLGERGMATVHCSQIDDLPRADVAPRAEVELWKGRVENVFAAIPKTRREFAREIFEEIERNVYKLETPYQVLHCISMGFLTELKKKYTDVPEPPKGD